MFEESSSEVVIKLLKLAVDTERCVNEMNNNNDDVLMKKATNRKFVKENDRRISLVYKQFAILSQLISALDNHLFITRQVRDQLALLCVTKQLHIHFYRYMLDHFNEHIPATITQRFNFTPRDEWNETVMVSSQLVNFERFQMENERTEYGRIIEMQKCVRNFGSYSKEIGEEDDDELIEIGSSVDGEMLCSIDEACTIVQSWERVYQSVARFNYLKEIRRKAYDLKTSHKPVDTLRVIIMLQARTRGMIARKMVHNWRNAEMKVLKMNVESLLQSKIDARKSIRYTKSVYGSVRIGRIQQNKLMQHFNNISLSGLLMEMRGDLLLQTTFLDLFGNDEVEENDNLERRNDKQDNLYHELLIADIIKHRPTTERISLNDLKTFSCMALIGKTKRLLFDCRTIIYCTTVIPHSKWIYRRMEYLLVLLVLIYIM